MRSHTSSGKNHHGEGGCNVVNESVSEDRSVFPGKNKLMAAAEASPENTFSSNDDAEGTAGDKDNSAKTRERMTRRYVRQQQLLQQEKMQSGNLGPDTSDDASNEASDVQLRSSEECSFCHSSSLSKETLSTSTSSSSSPPASEEGQTSASESRNGYEKKQCKKRRHRGFSPDQDAKRIGGNSTA
jgi:hypothetical protein